MTQKMKNKKGSALIWILIVLILLMVGLIVYFLLFSDSTDFRNSLNYREDNNVISNQNQENSQEGLTNKKSIPQPPALPSG